MTVCPGQPVIYEINTAVWLGEVSRRIGSPTTLAEVPAEEWDRVTPPGVDIVWLMGVWERSAAGLRIALESPENVASFRRALPDLEPDDVIGSAYCIRRYEVDDRFGGRAGLASARSALAERGVQLMVDFVPNHVAPDHPWLGEHPEYFVRGSAEDLAADPDGFLEVADEFVARGRDPFFPAWRDVVQVDAFAPSLRQAAVDTLVAIGDQADAVRCDMAMLLLNDVFSRTWGERVGPPPAEYWTEVIGAVRAVHPELLFIAEAYWDTECQLQRLGFDHCYDKRLYDRLVHDEPAAAVRAHLGADIDYQQHLVRFLENHDEPRAASEFAAAAYRAAAVAVATLPGATLWYEGQFDGRRVHVPVFLARRPDEPVDEALRRFHLALVAQATHVRRGNWAMCGARGWPDDSSCEQLLTWCWTDPADRSLVVVNDADAPAAARIQLPWDDLHGRMWRLDDLLAGETFERDGTELATEGLYVQLPARGFHVLAWTAADG